MNRLEAMPLWVAIPAAVFLVIGATLTFLGSLGFLQMKTFYERLHVTTLGSSWGAAGVLLASIIVASWAQERMVLQEVIIGIFILITGPVTLILLARAALHRDRSSRPDQVPGPVGRDSAIMKTGPAVEEAISQPQI